MLTAIEWINLTDAQMLALVNQNPDAPLAASLRSARMTISMLEWLREHPDALRTVVTQPSEVVR